MYRVTVFVTRKDGILDPGATVAKSALQKQGFGSVSDVQTGKLFVLTVEQTDEIAKMCETLLVNTVMEDYRYEIEEI